MINISTFSIKNPLPAIMLFVLLGLAGISAFRANVVQDYPDLEMPLVVVSASLPGSAPSQLETTVARKIEDSVSSIQGVKYVFSTIVDGNVTVVIQFELDKVLAQAVTEVRDAVGSRRGEFPSEMQDPTISKKSTAGAVIAAYVVEVAASGTRPDTVIGDNTTPDMQDLSWFVDDTVAKRLRLVPGMGVFQRVGGADREILLELNPDKMAALNISAADVSRQLRTVQVDAPGGRGDVSGAEQAIRTVAAVKTVDELARLDIPMPGRSPVQLNQIATVTDSVSEARARSYFNGKEVVTFQFFRAPGASEVTVATAARAAVAELQANHPKFVFTQAFDNAVPIEENFKESMNLLYEGAFLSIVVVMIFLRNWRATFIVASALPLSIIPTFLAMGYFGYTLNTVTLISLALVVGVLVDDAIVEIENIERFLEMGHTPMQAAMEAADEIGMAVIATTFALVAVFLPTAFMGGTVGQFFKPFGVTTVAAVLASLLVARLLTPMMAAYLMKSVAPRTAGAHQEPKDGRLMRGYLHGMQWCLRHRFITVAGAVILSAGASSLAVFLPTGFLPAADRGQTQIGIELPPGSTLAETTVITEQARIAAMSVSGVTGALSSIGGGSSGDTFAMGAAAEARRASILVTTVAHNQRKESAAELDNLIRNKVNDIPGARFSVGQAATGNKYQVILQSGDPIALLDTSRQIERELRTIKNLGNISSSAALVRPEIVIRPDMTRAADRGVTAGSIGDTLRIATAGDYDAALSKLSLDQRQVPIRVKFPEATRGDLAALGRLTVPGSHGPVMLSSVATVAMESGPATINRFNRNRQVTIDVELGGRPLGEINNEVQALPTMQNLPASVSLVDIGDAKEMQDLFASFGLAMLLGVLCVYGVLTLLFKDPLQPVTILAALPLSLSGAFVALLLTGQALSMPSLLGFIMLMGIVTKNSILLVDFAVLSREAGQERFAALVDACHKRSRPIIMTTIAMGAGMMPLALGFGSDPSFRSPMAIAVVGGLLTSTVLSLFVVPAVFTYVDDFEHFIKRMFVVTHPVDIAEKV